MTDAAVVERFKWPSIPASAQRVFVRVTLLSLDAIETASQTWSATIVCEFIFSAPEEDVAAAVGKEGDALKTVLRKHFWPVFSNVHELKHEEWWASAPKGIASAVPAGHAPITLSVKYKASFIQRFDFLHHYPFDSELLKIRLSMEQPCKTLAYATFDETQKAFPSTHGGLPHVVAVDGRLSSALTEWRLRDAIGARASLSSPSASRSSTQYSHLTVMIPVKRHSSFVVWNFIVPFSLVTFCMVLAFFLSIDSRGERLGIGSGLLLAAVAFKGSVSSLIPRVGRLTLLEWFIFVGILFIVVSTSVAVTLEDWPEFMLAAVGAVARSDAMSRVLLVNRFAAKAAAALQGRSDALAAAVAADPALLAGAAPAVQACISRDAENALEPVDNFLGVLLTLVWVFSHLAFVWMFALYWRETDDALQRAQGARTPAEQGARKASSSSCGWPVIDQDVDLEHYVEPPCNFKLISGKRHSVVTAALKTGYTSRGDVDLAADPAALPPADDEPNLAQPPVVAVPSDGTAVVKEVGAAAELAASQQVPARSRARSRPAAASPSIRHPHLGSAQSQLIALRQASLPAPVLAAVSSSDADPKAPVHPSPGNAAATRSARRRGASDARSGHA